MPWTNLTTLQCSHCKSLSKDMVPLNGSFNKWPLDYSYTVYPIFTYTPIKLRITRSCWRLFQWYPMGKSQSSSQSLVEGLRGSEMGTRIRMETSSPEICPKYLDTLENLLVLFPKYLDTHWITCFLGLGPREKNTKRPKPQNASSTIVCRVYPHLHLSLKIAFVLDHVKQDVSRKPITFIYIYMLFHYPNVFSVQNRQLDAP